MSNILLICTIFGNSVIWLRGWAGGELRISRLMEDVPTLCLLGTWFAVTSAITKLLFLLLRPARDSLMGIHPGHPPEPRQESRVNQVGRQVGGHLQVLEVGGGGSAVGQKEEQQQHDLRETQPGHEVRGCWSLHTRWPHDQVVPDRLIWAATLPMSSVTDITTKERSWNGWTDGDWCINSGRTHVDGEKMKTDPWNTTQDRPHIPASRELLDVNMSKTTFLCYLCTMRERGRKKKSTSNGKKEHYSW